MSTFRDWATLLDRPSRSMASLAVPMMADWVKPPAARPAARPAPRFHSLAHAQHHQQAGQGHDHGGDHLGQGGAVQGAEELGPPVVSHGVDEQGEEYPLDGRVDVDADLPDDHRGDQRPGDAAEGEFAHFEFAHQIAETQSQKEGDEGIVLEDFHGRLPGLEGKGLFIPFGCLHPGRALVQVGIGEDGLTNVKKKWA